jgi:hypothetical protein
MGVGRGFSFKQQPQGCQLLNNHPAAPGGARYWLKAADRIYGSELPWIRPAAIKSYCHDKKY